VVGAVGWPLPTIRGFFGSIGGLGSNGSDVRFGSEPEREPKVGSVDPHPTCRALLSAMRFFGCIPCVSKCNEEDAEGRRGCFEEKGIRIPRIDPLEGADEVFIQDLLHRHQQKFGKFATNPEKHKVQILWTEVRDWEVDGTQMRSSRYRVGQEYIYPASTVKLCAAVAALSQLRRLRNKTKVRVTPWTPLIIHPSKATGGTVLCEDPTNVPSGRVTVAHLIRKVFLASDNPAHNALCAVAGYQYLHETMWSHGLFSLMLHHPISAKWGEGEQHFAPAVEFWPDDGSPFSIPSRRWQPPAEKGAQKIRLGRAYFDEGGKRVARPMDFSRKNRFSLEDMHKLTLMICRPGLFGMLPFGLGEEDIRHLQAVMQLFTTESSNPAYELDRDWNKLFAPGVEKAVGTEGVRISNKIGQAYGFTIDSAFVEDNLAGRSFLLTVGAYTNKNGIFNDEIYEYADAEKFLATVAEELILSVS